jgi:hypothetical protein
MSLAVDNPIVNNPFEEPSRWWDYSEGQPVLREGRRPAGYYLRPRTRSADAILGGLAVRSKQGREMTRPDRRAGGDPLSGSAVLVAGVKRQTYGTRPRLRSADLRPRRALRTAAPGYC